MQGVWIERGLLSLREDLDMPQPRPDEALVQVRKAAICGTDLELIAGYGDFTGIPGHEFVGEVIGCPEEETLVGQRVTARINIACGACPPCEAGRPHHCRNRTVLGIRGRNGAFAEFISVPLANLVPVPDEISDDSAVFIEPLAAALRIQEQVPIGPAHRVLVLGAGRLGQLIARSLALTGCRLTVVARYPNQAALLETNGISCTDAPSSSMGEYDIVVEATGRPAGFSQALAAVRAEGTIVLKSTFSGHSELDLSTLAVKELTVIGSRCGRFEAAIDLLKGHRLDPTPLIDAQYPLSEALAAFEKARRPGTLKVMMRVHT
jgi:2-desacetyl-2-hydroxyethyl bacteriochlorophyllide A dehydrogenase